MTNRDDGEFDQGEDVVETSFYDKTRMSRLVFPREFAMSHFLTSDSGGQGALQGSRLFVKLSMFTIISASGGDELIEPHIVGPFRDGVVPMPDASAIWTTKELLTAIGATIVALIPVCLFFVRAMSHSTLRKMREETRLRKELQAQLDKPQDCHYAELAETGELDKQLSQAIMTAQQLETDLKATVGEKESHRLDAEHLKRELNATREMHQKKHSELTSLQKRVQRALQNEGPIWTEKIRADTPPFKPLDGEERRTPIISVLNLKGGVGKTTITANLGACLDNRDFRTLMLDLDLQGSLTSMFLSESIQQELFEKRKVLGEFLNRSFDKEFPSLLDFRQPILSDCKSGLIPTADDLAYAEMNLSVRWLLRAGNRDPRFLLRRELQLKRITSEHDVVLLDCPPLLNIFCVNAIAASDYVIIPIVPSKQSMIRVPVLLQFLKEFRTNINPHIKVLGIVCNRSFRSSPTNDETSRLAHLRRQCKDVWGEDVMQFETIIKQSTEIRTVEDERRPLGITDNMYQWFASLADEVIEQLPTFCLPRPAEAVSKSEVMS